MVHKLRQEGVESWTGPVEKAVPKKDKLHEEAEGTVTDEVALAREKRVRHVRGNIKVATKNNKQWKGWMGHFEEARKHAPGKFRED